MSLFNGNLDGRAIKDFDAPSSPEKTTTFKSCCSRETEKSEAEV
jgi:hypothetical protein